MKNIGGFSDVKNIRLIRLEMTYLNTSRGLMVDLNAQLIQIEFPSTAPI